MTVPERGSDAFTGTTKRINYFLDRISQYGKLGSRSENGTESKQMKIECSKCGEPEDKRFVGYDNNREPVCEKCGEIYFAPENQEN